LHKFDIKQNNSKKALEPYKHRSVSQFLECFGAASRIRLKCAIGHIRRQQRVTNKSGFRQVEGVITRGGADGGEGGAAGVLRARLLQLEVPGRGRQTEPAAVVAVLEAAHAVAQFLRDLQEAIRDLPANRCMAHFPPTPGRCISQTPLGCSFCTLCTFLRAT